MPYFPQINALGIAGPAQMETTFEFATDVRDMETGLRYAYSQVVTPIRSVQMDFQNITDDEIVVLRDFYDSMHGNFGRFIFLHPSGNLVPYSEDFTHASWTKSALTVGAAVADPFGGTRATSIAAGADGHMTATVIPDGDLPTGHVLTLSAWVRALGGSQSLETSFRTGSGSLAAKSHTLPQNQWKRIVHSAAISTASPVLISFGRSSSWGSSTIEWFNPQCVSGPGPSGEVRTPGWDGLWPICRFDMERFAERNLGPNQNTVSVTVQEIR